MFVKSEVRITDEKLIMCWNIRLNKLSKLRKQQRLYYFLLLFTGSTVFSFLLQRSAQRSTMGKKIWLSMHPRNFGSDL